MHLQLGDIIQIGDDVTYYFIEYIDATRIRFLTSDKKGFMMRIRPDGRLEDESIKQIRLISRAETPSYAQQNNLTPGTWVDVHFGGDLPAIITGMISNLDEDQIEIQLAGEKKYIYIDFAYRGLPPELSIERFKIREPPANNDNMEQTQAEQTQAEQTQAEQTQAEQTQAEESPELETQANEFEDTEPEVNPTIYLDADKLSFAPQITITHVVDVPAAQQRFGIEAQVNDMLDDFLSSIPNQERNDSVISSIHRTIERYKQLRAQYIDGPPRNGISYRPLIKTLQNMDTKLHWLLPVVSFRKRLYDTPRDDFEEDTDIFETTLAEDRIRYEEQIKNATTHQELLKAIHQHSMPIIAPVEKAFHVLPAQTSMTAIGNNIDGYFCSTIKKNDIHNHRFYMHVFIPGQKILETYKKEQRLVPATEHEKMHIGSFISLPESAIDFSRVSRPGSNIAVKSHLSHHFIAYTRLLTSTTPVARKLIEEPSRFNKFKTVTEYIPKENDPYDNYLFNMIPSTIELLNRYKNTELSGNITVRTAISYLEPFSVYMEDICDEHLRPLLRYIKDKISEIKTRRSSRLEAIAFLSAPSPEYETRWHTLTQPVNEAYNLGDRNDGERWSQLMLLDGGRMFYATMALDAVDLMVAEGLLRFGENTDTTKVVAKEYASKSALEKDNFIDVYYDSDRDPTFYGIVGEYESEMANQSNKVEFLSKKLQETNGLSIAQSEREARAMIQNKRIVEEGEYALLNGVHYKRVAGKWEEQDKANTGSTSNFDERLQQNKEEMTKLIQAEHSNAMQRIAVLNQIKNNRKYRYEKQKFNIGGAIEIATVDSSPCETLRDAVLGEEDFVKRQHYINKFVDNFTRPADLDENPWWLYCLSSGAPIIPTFVKRLADAFLNNEDYLATVEMICAEQGKLSDDDSSWVDKYTGYAIVPITFSAQEGYTEGGFKAKTREILEPDVADDAPVKKLGPEAQMVTNIVRSMSTFLGIDIEPSMEFILQSAVRRIGVEVPTKERYAKKLGKKGNKMPPYEKMAHQGTISISIAYLLIAIQTSIPTLRTQKRHPGCVKSFSGYPLGDENDKSGLKYLVCVAYHIKSKVAPWDSIYKLKQDSLYDKVIRFLERIVASDLEAQRRIAEKQTHLVTTPDVENEPQEGLIQWTMFRPSLRPVDPGVVEPMSADFTNRLKESLKKGSKDQFDMLHTMQVKISKYTEKIQQLIEAVVQKNKPTLATVAGDPFLENACCNEDTPRTFAYFADKSPDIVAHEEAAARLQRIILDVNRMAQSSILFDPSSTKQKIPLEIEDYSEETIYRSFIHYCKYHSKMPMGDELQSICLEKPSDFDIGDTFDEQIRKLKRGGYNYNSESLHQLMQIIHKRNMLPPVQTAHQANVLSVHIIQSIVRDDDVIPQAFKDNLDMMIENGDEEIRAMKNYLAGLNEIMARQLAAFCDRYNVNKALLTCHNVNGCILFLTRLFPNMVTHRIDYSGVTPPKHWNLSMRHQEDFQNLVNKHYHKLYKLYEDADIIDILSHVRAATVDFETLWAHVGIVDERMEALLREFYFYLVLLEYVEPNIADGVEEIKGEDSDDEQEIVDGNREKRNQTVGLIFESYAHVLLSEQATMGYTYDTLMERIHRAKEKEKDVMTEFLRDMTDEQREVENLLKNSKLGNWSKGLQKGLRAYQGRTYDEEREEMERQAIVEQQAGEKNVITEMNRDIYAMDHIAEQLSAQEIEAEEMLLHHLGEDDDHGERDGDEFY